MVNPQKIWLLTFLLGIFISFSQPQIVTALPTISQVEELLRQGRSDKAWRILQQALERRPHSPKLLALNARLLERQGELNLALQSYQKALENNDAENEPHERLVILNNYFLALNYQQRLVNQQIKFLELDDKTEKIALLKQQLQLNRQTQRSLTALIRKTIPSVATNKTVVRSYLLLGDWQKAEEAALRDDFPLYPDPEHIPIFVELAPYQDDPIAFLLGALPRADLKGQVRLYSALAQYDPSFLPLAISHAQQAQMNDYLFKLYNLQAELGISPQNSRKLAVIALSRIRSQLISPHPEITFLFQEQVIPTYRAYLTELLRNPTPENLKEARITFDRLQIAQVENLFNALCITRSVDIEGVLAQKNAGLMQVIVLNDAYHVLLSLPNGVIKHHRVPIDSSALAAKLIQWRKDLKIHTAPIPYLDTAHELYQAIIAPFQSEIDSLDELFLIGDEYFRSIPFTAFYDGQSFLIEQVPITTLLSWNLIANIPAQQQELLAFALKEARPPFSNPIPFAEKEVHSISHLLPRSAVFVGNDFTEQSLREELLLKEPQVLHIASHALFTGNPSDSIVLTYDDSLNLFELQQILRRSHPVRLMILSACETSNGNNLATLGMAGVAARGRVQTTIGSLWQTDDRQSAQFMLDFYQRLTEGNRPTVALQQAQIQAIRSGLPPKFWSLFILIGN